MRGVLVQTEGYIMLEFCAFFFFFQAEDGIRDLVRSRGLGDVYKRQTSAHLSRLPPKWSTWKKRLPAEMRLISISISVRRRRQGLHPRRKRRLIWVPSASISGSRLPPPSLLQETKCQPSLSWPRPMTCLLYTSPSPRDRTRSRMPSSA